MPDNIEVRVNDVGDILYLRFRKAKIASCREFGDLRNLDYDRRSSSLSASGAGGS